MTNVSKNCGCKGIRSCLICEETTQNLAKQSKDTRDQLIYKYCPKCDLCMPEDTSLSPLYLGKILLVPDFITEEEESFLISSIDQITWSPSQSGRKKQDFGPKVNFKKKKVKIGNFKGFPAFTKDLIEKMHCRSELSDFVPVELCHLEYTPCRGSSIEPHVDDFWLWGERLVTINLQSSTVLTLTPTCTTTCLDCPEKLHCSNGRFVDISVKQCKHEHNICLKAQDNVEKSKPFQNLCTVYQKNLLNTHKVEVKIELPPRSLFVLFDCARYNWFHEIRRLDVTARRLAMTFRELSVNFPCENNESREMSNQLLEVADKFYDLNMNNAV